MTLTADSPRLVPAARHVAAADPTVTAHALRLALNLQLDTLTYTVAAAAAAGRDDPGAAVLPWRRWLAEDVESLLDLTAGALDRDGALPATLACAHPCHHPVHTALAARYEELLDLLDLLDVTPPGDAHRRGTPGERPAVPLAQLRRRYAARLASVRGEHGARPSAQGACPAEPPPDGRAVRLRA